MDLLCSSSAWILQGQHPSAVQLFNIGYRLMRELRERPSDTRSNALPSIGHDLHNILSLDEVYFHRLAVQILMVRRCIRALHKLASNLTKEVI